VGSLGLFPTRPVAALASLVRIEPLATKTLLEFIGVGLHGKAVNMKPLSVMEHRVTSVAERHVLAELVNLFVAAAFTQTRGQHNLVWPAEVNGGWRQLALASHPRTAA
jgi:hypothetical protein